MNTLPKTLGLWSAAMSALLFIAFTICFVMLFVSNPATTSTWSSLSAYIDQETGQNQSLKYLAQLCMLLFCPLYLVWINCIHEETAPHQKILTRISLSFGITFSTLTAMLYFVQLTTVRLGIAYGYVAGIEPFLQFYPYAGILSIGMLGITIFLGLSSLFVAPVFRGSKLKRWICFFFIVNGLSCLIGGLAFLLDHKILIHLTINIGMGGALMILSLLLTRYFYQR